MNSILVVVGRTLFALYFLIPGIMKFTGWDGHVQYMQSHGVPAAPILLAIAAFCQVAGAIALIFNRFTWIVALLFALMVLIINGTMHDFWNYTGTTGAHEMQNFIKNLAIFAGLLVLSAYSMPEKFKSKS